MSQPENQEIPQLLAEYSGMTQNVETLTLIEGFLCRVEIFGKEAPELSRCLHWVDGMRQGMQNALDQIRAKLPKENTENKLSEPDAQAAKAVPVAVGGMEISKGEPINLGAR